MKNRKPSQNSSADGKADQELNRLISVSQRILKMQDDSLRKAGTSFLAPDEDERKPWETFI